MIVQKLEIQGRIKPLSVWKTPSLIFGGLGLATLVAAEMAGPDDWSVLGWICALSLAYSMFVLYRGFRDGVRRVLTDPFLILVGAFSIYFLLGTLYLVIGSEDQTQEVLSWYPTNAQDAVRVTAMNLIGLATMLLAAGLFASGRIEIAVRPAIGFFSKFPIEKVFWLFLIVGVVAKLCVLPSDLSSDDGEVVLGTLRTLAGLTQIAILTGIIYQGRGAGVVHAIAVTVALFDSAAGLLLFNKSAVLMPIVVLLLGQYLLRPNVKLVVTSVVVLAAIFFFIANPISEARLIFSKNGDGGAPERLETIKEVFESDDLFTYGSKSWSRFCYTVAQVAAVDLYDSNDGGEDFELLAWAFVPRAIVPSKPIMTRSGTDFNAKITGSDSSSTGMGLFVSGYYNLGWIGLVLASTLAGWILATFAAISRAIVAANSIIMMPVALLGSFIAFRVDGHFVSDYVGTFGMVMVPLLITLFALRVLGSRDAGEPGR